MSKEWVFSKNMQNADSTKQGYHLSEITKGKYGTWGKVVEEWQEFKDALNQKSSIMSLVELSDLYGALAGYRKIAYNENLPAAHALTQFPSIIEVCDLELRFFAMSGSLTDDRNFKPYLRDFLACLNIYLLQKYKLGLSDLDIFSLITARVFQNGYRQESS